MGSASWIQEGTPVLPLWHPHSTVFYQLTLYPLVNWSPSLGTLAPLHYRGEPPHAHSLRSSSQHMKSPLWRASLYPQFTLVFSTHKPNLKKPQSSFMVGIYRQWSCLQLCQVDQSAYCSLLTLFGIPASHTPPLLKFNY